MDECKEKPLLSQPICKTPKQNLNIKNHRTSKKTHQLKNIGEKESINFTYVRTKITEKNIFDDGFLTHLMMILNYFLIQPVKSKKISQ